MYDYNNNDSKKKKKSGGKQCQEGMNGEFEGVGMLENFQPLLLNLTGLCEYWENFISLILETEKSSKHFHLYVFSDPENFTEECFFLNPFSLPSIYRMWLKTNTQETVCEITKYESYNESQEYFYASLNWKSRDI